MKTVFAYILTVLFIICLALGVYFTIYGILTLIEKLYNKIKNKKGN